MPNESRDIGAVSAYALAVVHGYKGTEEEWAVLQAESGINAQRAEAAAEGAANSAQVAEAAATQAAKTMESIPADYMKLAQDVSKLSGEMDDVKSSLSEWVDAGIEPQVGFCNIRMQLQTNNSYRYIAAPVNEGEKIKVTGTMPAVAGLAICVFADAEGKAVGTYKKATADAEAIANGEICEVPAGAVMVYVNSKTSVGVKLERQEFVDVVGRLEDAEKTIEETRNEFNALSAEMTEQVNQLSGDFESITNTVTGANILPPDSVVGYLDTTDGITMVSNVAARCSTHTLNVDASILYAIVNPAAEISGTGIICVMHYDDNGAFIRSSTVGVAGTNILMQTSLSSGGIKTSSVRIWTNSHLELADVCISTEPLDTFEPYNSRVVIADDAINLNPILPKVKPFHGKIIVNFGDSIFGNKRPPNDVSTALANCTGATVHNCGFGGCRMASHTIANFDAFSMYRLADAIVSGDYSVQDAAIESGKIAETEGAGKLPSYFEGSLALLKSLDFAEVDIITIAYGTNDWTGNKALDNESDAYDTARFCGALRYSLERLIAAYPHIKIFICGQTYRFWMDGDGNFTEDSDTKVIGSNKLTDFVAATKAVANEYHIPFVDNYNPLGINKHNRGYYFPATDGTHHNVLGARLIAEHIAHELW